MLMKFEITNFKNFKEKFIFDFTRTKNYEFNPECIKNGVINKSIIYGPNGCGKTNLGYAILDIVSHLTDNRINPSKYQNYLNAASSMKEAEFRYTFKFDENIVEYSYGKKSLDLLTFENLSINNQKVISYDRTKDKKAFVDLRGAESLNKDLGDTNISVVKYVQNNTVLISGETNSIFKKFMNFISGMLFFSSSEKKYFWGHEQKFIRNSEKILNKGLLKDFESFLNNADIECELEEIEVDGIKAIAFKYGKNLIEFSQVASTGTLALGSFYFWLQDLKEDTIPFIYIDEFDAFYHHKLSKQVVKQVKETECQAVLTTHNTTIMSNDLLRPDCYFIMEKNTINPIWHFTEKELRKAHNIEKMYKAGAFSE